MQTGFSDPMVSLVRRVSSKLKGAVRIACLKDSFAVIDDSVLSARRIKLPSPHPDTCFPNAPKIPALLTPILGK